MSAAAPQPPFRGAEKSNGGAWLLEENHREQLLLSSGQVTEASRESDSAEGLHLQRQQEDDEDNDKWQQGRPQPSHVVEAPPPKENPWTRWKPPPNSGSLSPSSASAGGGFSSKDPELQSSTKVIKAGKLKIKKPSKADDFSDATNWPTPSEIASSECKNINNQNKKAPIKKEKEEKNERKSTNKIKENLEINPDIPGENVSEDEGQINNQKKK
ncbi:la-related protein 1, partial [Python bivittatus]|uniref:La-related protein 1 n=1 Tax=Python bivittatus TaxID=176946 RepID=A0A9F2RBX4_PYTBI